MHKHIYLILILNTLSVIPKIVAIINVYIGIIKKFDIILPGKSIEKLVPNVRDIKYVFNNMEIKNWLILTTNSILSTLTLKLNLDVINIGIEI